MITFFTEFNRDKEISLEEGQVKIAPYYGSILYTSLTNYFDQFIQSQIEKQEKNTDVELHQIQNGYQFSQCEKYRLCVYGVIDPDDKEKNSYHEKVGVIKRILGKHKQGNIDVKYFDGMCYHDVLAKLGINVEDMPTVFAYHYNKNEYFSLQGTFDYESIDTMIGKSLIRRGIVNPMPEGIEIPIRNCHSYKQKYLNEMRESAEAAKKDIEDDDLMREVIEEAKRKEAEREASKGSAGSKKKRYETDL